jgi:hypothetical protein
MLDFAILLMGLSDQPVQQLGFYKSASQIF